MNVNCETCGKLFRIDTEKIKGEKAKFTCSNCHNDTIITIPEFQVPELDSDIAFNGQTAQKTSSAHHKWLGLRPKMVFLFVVIPIILVVVSGMTHLKHMDTLSSVLTKESSTILEKIGQEIIVDKARSVADQCGTFLRKNPQLKREDFSKDKDFASIATQKVGETGYTAIYTPPDNTGSSSVWVHPNPRIIGIDLPKAMRKPLGDRYNDFIKVYSGAYRGRESMGYYLWKDKDGQLREKFMVCTPIKGTQYIIASTTYMDEFTKDLKLMTNRANTIISGSRNTAFQVFAGTLLILGVIVALFSNGLSKRVRTLTDLAERISLGELGVKVSDKSKDEIGHLATAIERMRACISISLEKM